MLLIDFRFVKYLLYMGLSTISAREMKVDHFCKMVADFALEYRTTREKVLQQQQKKANNRERKKTRGKMIVDVSMISFSNLLSILKKMLAFILI